MKEVKIAVLATIVMFGLIGCKPDLVVQDLDVTWDETGKIATATIANIGDKDAGEFMIYFNAEEMPISQNHRPQVSFNETSLGKGEQISRVADFETVAHPDNSNLGRVYLIRVIVDPKNMVNESDETNNEMEFALSMEGCVDFEQQVLSTVYHVGDSFTESGLNFTLEPFQWGNNAWTSTGHATIENTQRAGHLGKEIGINNITIKTDFAPPVQGLTLLFGEFGGNLNIKINGDFRNFQNFADINGSTIGATNVLVINGSGQDKGFLDISGAVSSFEVGGQELWIDHICPK